MSVQYMTKSIREAAEALLAKLHKDAEDLTTAVTAAVLDDECLALRAALSAQQPTADERVAELMRLVDEFSYAAGMTAVGVSEGVVHGSPDHSIQKQRFNRSRDAVEQSARALLSAPQEDAEHAAMYRWLRKECQRHSNGLTVALVKTHALLPWSGDDLDRAVRAAMKETK